MSVGTTASNGTKEAATMSRNESNIVEHSTPEGDNVFANWTREGPENSQRLTSELLKAYPYLVMYDGSNDLDHITKFYEGFYNFCNRLVSHEEALSGEYLFVLIRMDHSRRKIEKRLNATDEKVPETLDLHRYNLNKLVHGMITRALNDLVYHYRDLLFKYQNKEAASTSEADAAEVSEETLSTLASRANICSVYFLEIVDDFIADYERGYDALVSNKTEVCSFVMEFMLVYNVMMSIQYFYDACEDCPQLFLMPLQLKPLSVRRKELMAKWKTYVTLHDAYDEAQASIYKMTSDNLINMMLDKKTKLRGSLK